MQQERGKININLGKVALSARILTLGKIGRISLICRKDGLYSPPPPPQSKTQRA